MTRTETQADFLPVAAEHTNARGFRSDIQALRAVAVLGVVLNHATDRLTRARESSGRLRFGEFCARRTRRILPASPVVGALTMSASMYALPATTASTR